MVMMMKTMHLFPYFTIIVILNIVIFNIVINQEASCDERGVETEDELKVETEDELKVETEDER